MIENKSDTVYKGIVTYFTVERHFGFIESDDHQDLFFFIEKTRTRKSNPEGRKLRRETYFRGDEVYYKIKRSSKNENRIEACDVSFIKNDKIDEYLALIREQKPLTGYIKYLDGCYYIKDKQTYLFTPLEISMWEVGLEEVYESRINEAVSYVVEKIPKYIKNMTAVLTDRIFSTQYYQLCKLRDDQELISVRITGVRRDGYFASFLDNSVSTFIHFDKSGTTPTDLKKGDFVIARISTVNSTVVKVKLVNQ